jgi:aminoglycoside 6'-N-acetyltransferase I
MKIIDLDPDNLAAIQQAAAILMEGFREDWPNAWPDLDAARQEVQSSFGQDRMSRIAVDETGTVLGWIGGIRQYDGHVWELHPLVVKVDCQGQGIGSALVRDLERQVKDRGAITLWLGTDDENNMTSLSGRDLFPNVLEHLAGIRNLRGHPFEFYQKLGFSIVGVLPDANGWGKPDVYMAKRVAGR